MAKQKLTERIYNYLITVNIESKQKDTSPWISVEFLRGISRQNGYTEKELNHSFRELDKMLDIAKKRILHQLSYKYIEMSPKEKESLRKDLEWFDSLPEFNPDDIVQQFLPRKLLRKTVIPSLPSSRKVELYLAQEKKCKYCDEEFKIYNLTFDHVIPSSRGGTNSRKNLVLACRKCNEEKSNRMPAEWTKRHYDTGA